MTAGASRVELKITRQPVLAPSPQPRPAPTARALPPKHAGKGGQNWTPIGGQIWKPIDKPFQQGECVGILEGLATLAPDAPFSVSRSCVPDDITLIQMTTVVVGWF